VCGRFTQAFSYSDLHAYFSFFGQPLGNLEPRFSLCPTQDIIVALPAPDGAHKLERMRWGLVPPWWKKPLRELPSTFNARAETVAEKPTFRAAFRARRCIIPASGTYEWQDRTDGKQPWYFTPAEGPLLLIAGLWEEADHPEQSGKTIRSATMVITDANSFVAQYHDRMPVLLDSETMKSWMSGEAGHELLKPATETMLKAHPVSRRLNNARVGDNETLIQPVEIRPVTIQPDFLL
jgi:putative SOS response-associated peptidase YedK